MSRLAALSLVGALLVVLAAPRLHAQPPAPSPSASAQPSADPSAAPAADPSADASAAPAPEAPAPPDPAAPTEPSGQIPAVPSPAGEPLPPATTVAAAPSLASVAGPGRGAIVVALAAKARPAARSLARSVYRDPKLRPDMSEAMAGVLLGASPSDPGDLQQTEAQGVVASLEAVSDDSVRRRLLASLGSDLGVNLVVLVDHPDTGPRARVLRMPEGKLLAVTLTAEPQQLEADRAGWDWRDALAILRGLVSGPPPGPRAAPPRSAPAAAVSEGEEDEWAMLKSPWFWGTLGVVVTVGVTVLVLSQTALNEPDVVMLEGRVGR